MAKVELLSEAVGQHPPFSHETSGQSVEVTVYTGRKTREKKRVTNDQLAATLQEVGRNLPDSYPLRILRPYVRYIHHWQRVNPDHEFQAWVEMYKGLTRAEKLGLSFLIQRFNDASPIQTVGELREADVTQLQPGMLVTRRDFVFLQKAVARPEQKPHS